MTCKYDDGNGWCTGKFKGFGCIKRKCDSYLSAGNEKGDCTCIPGNGTYCYKYNLFFCAGEENCIDSKTYTKKMEMSQC